jgi:hypothetical protein
MRRVEYSRRLEEASCGVRGELLNRGSGVRVPAPAPLFCIQFRSFAGAAVPRRIATILPIVWLRPGYTEPDPNSGAAVFRTASEASLWLHGAPLTKVCSRLGKALHTQPGRCGIAPAGGQRSGTMPKIRVSTDRATRNLPLARVVELASHVTGAAERTER